MQELLNPLQQQHGTAAVLLLLLSFFSFTSNPSCSEMSWGELNCTVLRLLWALWVLEPPWGLNPWSWCSWLSVLIRTSQIGKTIMSYTDCRCWLSKKVSYYSIPATPSVQFVRPCPHTLGVEYCVWRWSLFVSFSFFLFNFFSFFFFYYLYYRRTVDDIISTYHLWLNTFMQEIIVKNCLPPQQDQIRTEEEKNVYCSCFSAASRDVPRGPLLLSRPLILFNSILPSVIAVSCALC